ncbi:class I SAM-dependent methyltransferase [Actinomadura madurae]|uniref:class I SAM-dependent methyltransferase n=2 Tax=Actinomadura madurae TaxID=1993 RepID=UPI0020D1F73D|nr:class I SAM-dependent methyltransferase [Actinomadura madurae]MCP9955414.1 methyltransferase domain-containing protein [Actinomadura madurae]MCP9984651.1 methyltransferase domain-containing protein [Actinomadura madurae]MCQ0020844.1 methyltransferase domain-containing protein [Actinomadura madurae]
MPYNPAVQDRITRYWDQHAPAYQRFQEQRLGHPDYSAAWTRVWRNALPDGAATVLDVGTGTGHAALTIAALGPRVTGIDLAPAMVAYARDNARARGLDITFVQGDAVDPAVPGAPFDALVSRYLLWTLPGVDTALGNWRRLLRPGGRLAVVDAPWHAGGMRHPDTDPRARAYDEEARRALVLAEAETITAWQERITGAGFVDVEVAPLTELFELDGVHGVAPDHRRTLQHLITVRNPGTE